MEFKKWLVLLETTTIAQTIKQELDSSEEEHKNLLKQLLDFSKSQVDLFPPVISKNLKKIYINYFAWTYFEIYKRNPSTNNRFDLTNNSEIVHRMKRFIDEVKDYLIAKKDNNSLKSRLNTTSFKGNQLRDESQDWHNEIALKKAKPAREAETFIDLSHLGSKWQGWRWVSLDRRYCELEAASAGHCGNIAGETDDNILSLRDPQNIAHLTFIENNGILGEMKGRSNAKPSPKYHQPIIELLKNDKIKSIKGGGHAPQHNFSLDDLPNKEEMLQIKPELEYDKHIKKILSNEELDISHRLVALEDLVNTGGGLSRMNVYNNDNLKFGQTDDIIASAYNISGLFKDNPEWENFVNYYERDTDFCRSLKKVAEKNYYEALEKQELLRYRLDDSDIEKIIKSINEENMEYIINEFSEEFTPFPDTKFFPENVKNHHDVLIHIYKFRVPHFKDMENSGTIEHTPDHKEFLKIEEDIQENYRERVINLTGILFVIIRFCALINQLSKIYPTHFNNIKDFYEKNTKENFFIVKVEDVCRASYVLNKNKINDFFKKIVQFIEDSSSKLDEKNYHNIIKNLIQESIKPYIPPIINLEFNAEEFNDTLADYFATNEGLVCTRYAKNLFHKRLWR